MITSTVIAAALVLGQTGYVWTLYENDPAVTLAHEQPDTAALKTTLECDRGSGAAKLSIYGATAIPAFVTVRSGQASAAAESGALAGAPDALTTTIRTDHPVFSAFAASGALTVVAGASDLTVKVGQADLAKLRRFTQLCSG